MLQGQVNMLQDDLKDRKAEFEERARVTQDELNQTIAEQQKNQVLLKKNADEALARAQVAEEKF